MVDGTTVDVNLGPIGLRIGRSSGEIESLSFRGRELLNVGCPAGVGVDISVDGFSAEPVCTGVESGEVDGGVEVRVELSFDDATADRQGTRRYAVVQTWTVRETPAVIERRLTIKRLSGGGISGEPMDRFLSATLRLGGVAVGEAETTSVSCPMARIVPGAPLSEMLQRPRFFRGKTQGAQHDLSLTSPDGFPGAVCLASDDGLHVSITPAAATCPVRARIFGRDGGVVVEHEFGCASWLDVGDQIEAACQVVRPRQADWRRAVPAIGRGLAEMFPPVPDRPEWIDNAIIYESEPTFDGGFAGLAAKLDAIRSHGANTVYLMPWHRGGYMTRDYYAVDEKYGTPGDLKAVVSAAHDRGLRVLFDMLVNIMSPESPMLTEHPEFFHREPGGRIRRHGAWGGPCLDCGSPEFRKYMVDYATWCVSELGCDGFRVDAASHRGPNWNSLPGLQPHEHSHAVFVMLDEIRRAIRTVRADAILMAECFGPVQASVCDLVCYQWMFSVDWLMESLRTARMRGADLQRHLAEQVWAMPEGTRLVYYTHTHDSLAFLKRDLREPMTRAMFASLSLLGSGVMYFGGGWGMKGFPEPDEIDDYRRLFELRTGWGAPGGLATEFPETRDRDLMVYRKVGPDQAHTVITNFSDGERSAALSGKQVFSRTGGSRTDGGRVRVGPFDTIVLSD